MAYVSAHYSLTNSTGNAMLLSAAELKHGRWNERGPPAPRIEPGQTENWRNNSSSVTPSDASGVVTYAFEGAPQRTFSVFWDAPAAGANELPQGTSSNRIQYPRSLTAKRHSHPRIAHEVSDAPEDHSEHSETRRWSAETIADSTCSSRSTASAGLWVR